MTLEAAVEAACGSAPRAATPLLGGCIAEVYRLDFDDRPPLVAKVARPGRSEEHTSELQSLRRISYAVFCLKKKKTTNLDQHLSDSTVHSSCIPQSAPLHTPDTTQRT